MTMIATRDGVSLYVKDRGPKDVPHATLIDYAGAPHGLPDTHKDRFHADVLAFQRG